MLLSFIKADFLKTKRLSIRAAHLLIPIATASIFIAYYSYAPWSDYVKVDVYYQVIGMTLPILIGLFCAMVSEQEHTAGGFQSMLMVPQKTLPFLSKLILMLSFEMVALLIASVLFGVSFFEGLHNHSIPLSYYFKVPCILLGSSVFLYIFHFYLAFNFNKGVSIGLGIVEGLISALFLTDMGKFVWMYVPAAWPARMASTYLAAYTGDSAASSALHDMMPICIISSFGALVLYFVWASHWEGQKTYE